MANDRGSHGPRVARQENRDAVNQDTTAGDICHLTVGSGGRYVS